METIKKIDRKNKLWTLQYIIILSVMLFASIALQMFLPTMPLYVEHLGGNKATAGLANSLLAMAALLFRPISGWALDIKGRRAVILSGAIIFSVGIILINIIPTITIVLIGRFIQGAGFSMVTTGAGTAVTDIIPKEKFNEGIGYFGLSNSISTAIGPSIALFIIASSGYWWVFSTAFIMVAIVAVVTLNLNYENRMETYIVKNQKKQDIIRPKNLNTLFYTLFEKTAIPASIVQCVLQLGVSSILNFLAYYGLSIGISEVGVFFIIGAVFMVLTRLFIANLMNKFGKQKLMIFTIFLAGVAYIFLAFTKSLYMLLFIGAIYGIAQGITMAILNIMAVKDAPPNRRGAANATYYCALDIGYGLGSILWGKIADMAGFQVVYLCTALIMGVAIILVFLLLDRKILLRY